MLVPMPGKEIVPALEVLVVLVVLVVVAMVKKSRERLRQRVFPQSTAAPATSLARHAGETQNCGRCAKRKAGAPEGAPASPPAGTGRKSCGLAD